MKGTNDIDIVLHHAALGSVQRSLENPILSSSVNVEGTLNILKAASENGVQKLIFSSSSSVYGDTSTLPKTEDMPPSPKSIYAVTKMAGEYYCRLFYGIYGLKTITLRSKYLNKKINPVFEAERKGDIKHSLAAIEKIKKDLHYVPVVYFNEGLQKFINNIDLY